MEMSAEIKDIAAALAAAQAEIATAAKDRVNPHFRAAYATLASVWEACRDPLTKNGLSVVQSPKSEGAIVTLTTLLLHKSGQWFKDTLTMQAANGTPQSIGSAITYARRYALAAMVGVAPDDDDDGNAGQGRESAPAHAHQANRAAVPEAAVEIDPETKEPYPAGIATARAWMRKALAGCKSEKDIDNLVATVKTSGSAYQNPKVTCLVAEARERLLPREPLALREEPAPVAA